MVELDATQKGQRETRFAGFVFFNTLNIKKRFLVITDISLLKQNSLFTKSLFTKDMARPPLWKVGIYLK